MVGFVFLTRLQKAGRGERGWGWGKAGVRLGRWRHTGPVDREGDRLACQPGWGMDTGGDEQALGL